MWFYPDYFWQSLERMAYIKYIEMHHDLSRVHYIAKFDSGS